MRIERFYYIEAKREQEKRQRKRARRYRTEKIMPEELDDEQAVDAALSMLFPERYAVYTMIDPKKRVRFWRLADVAMDLAKEIGANLLIETEGFAGCIVLAGEELGGQGDQKLIFSTLGAAADEIHIRTTEDHGTGSPLDLDGLVQLEFWFDLCESVETEE